MLLFLVIAALYGVQGSEICYQHYGCFSDAPPFDFNLVQLPEDPITLDTKFWLYTRKNGLNNPHKISDLAQDFLNRTYFDAHKKTAVIVHGYIESHNKPWVRDMVEALLKRSDQNVIVVDWQRGARFPYHQVVGNARLVASQLTNLLKTLKSFSGDVFSYQDTHCIGFGSGAHICGYVGRNVKNNGTEILARISGLDPSAPYYEYRDIAVRLDPSDASFVDVIHTDTKTIGIKGFGTAQPLGHMDFYPNGGYKQPSCRVLDNGFGTAQPLGHMDFYPNGGFKQPSCSVLDNGVAEYFTCSHYRAARYFIESIQPVEQTHCPFRGYHCKTYLDFALGRCRSCPKSGCPSMGYDAIEHKDQVNGTFYLQTSGKKPFCAHHYNIGFSTLPDLLGDLNGEVYVTLIGERGVSETITIPRFYFAKGSTNHFLIHTRMDLGNLEKIQIQHGAWIDFWKLDDVIVRPMWNKKTYTACFKRWLNSKDNLVKLQENIAGCT